MPGFTPINAHAVKVAAPTATGPLNDGETQSVEPKRTKRRQPARKKIATPSAADQIAVEGEVRDVSDQKRISGKGRKRTNPPSDEPQTKRRKSGNVKSSMPTTKSGVAATATSDSANANGTKALSNFSTDAEMVSLTSKAKLDGFHYSSKTAPEHVAAGSRSVGSMSVFTPQTSMSSVQQSQSQTTMQAVKSSAGGSSLLYSSSATLSSADPGIDISRPLLSSSQFPTRINGNAAPLPTPAGSDPLTAPSESNVRPGSRQTLRSDSGDFGEPIDEDDDEMIELTRRAERSARSEQSPPARARKLNIRDTHAHDDYGGALLTDEERKLLDAIKIPQEGRRPVVRTSFPSPIMDRTSLFGVTSSSALRTCFRVGEALNTGCQAVRDNRNLVLELYARVTSSWREPKPSRKQHFIINDLYHDKPPYTSGTYELWDQSALWEQDSHPFLKAGAGGILCRTIARMKRDGTKWKLEILSIWQVDWEDVEHVAGIYSKAAPEEAP